MRSSRIPHKKEGDDLLARLNGKEKISDEDEEWLDNAGNVIEEEAVVDLPDNASDYEQGLTQLTSQQKILVKKLKELGGGVNKALLRGNKRKSTCNVLTLLLLMKVKVCKKRNRLTQTKFPKQRSRKRSLRRNR